MRVKCANCGMVYDKADPNVGSWLGQSGALACPGCRSNAADPIDSRTKRHTESNRSGPRVLTDAKDTRDDLLG